MQVLVESVGYKRSQERQAMNLLQKLRVERGYSLRKLAELSGVNKVTIQKIESGQVRPQVLSLSRLARGLGITVEELLPLQSIDDIPTDENQAEPRAS